MNLTEIKEQLETKYGIDVADFHVLLPDDQTLAKRKYHKVTRLINEDSGDVWNVWCNPDVWEKRTQ